MMKDEDVSRLIWAIERLADEIAAYRKIKERGVRLAERIENDREMYRLGEAWPRVYP